MAARVKKAPPTFSFQERAAKSSRSLPLVGEGWNRGVDRVAPLQRDSGCRACELGAKVNTPCMSAYDAVVGDGPRLLVVGGSPTQVDDSEGGINPDGIVSQVVNEITKHWSGTVRYVYAVACAAGKEVPEESLVACRGYLANEITTYRPDRILAVGDIAVRSLFGHRVSTFGVRRSWGHVMGVPTFTSFNPQVGLHNRFASRWWRDDIRWALTQDTSPVLEGEVRILGSVGEVEDYLASLTPGLVTTVDCEWRGRIWYDDYTMLCVGLCQDPLRPVVIPGDVAEAAQAALCRWFADPRYPKAGHNFKEDRHALWRALGADVAAATVDTLSWARQRESDSPAGLKSLAWNVGWGGYAGDTKDEAEDEEGKKDFSRLDPDHLHLYNARDIVVTHKVMDWLQPQMGRYQSTWEQLIRPAQTALLHVERWGALLSADNVRTYDRWLTGRIEKLDTQLREHGIPVDFNPASPIQMRKLMLDTLHVRLDPKRVSKKTKNPSFDRDALEAYKDQHPAIQVLLDHGNYRKQRSSFGVGLLEHIGYDGRVHASYRVVRSGRLSCKNPNLQQVTSPGIKPGETGWEERKGEDEGVWARGCWVAPPGYKLVQCDFAQMELRVAAMLSGDEVMAEAFEAGYDFHRMTASAAYSVAPGDVTADQRRVAKVINFAIIFGMDEHGIANSTGLAKSKAKELLNSLLGKYRKFDAWRRAQIAASEISGESLVRWNPPGGGVDWVHRRDNWGIGETGRDREADGKRKHGANVALNGPIQTIANCFSLASLSEVVRWILDEEIPARVVATVHDSLLLEVREDLAEEAAVKVAGIMCSWPSGVCRLKADAEVGDNWGELYKVKVG